MRRLQALLCVAGFDARPIDGDFGERTTRAVRACQTANRLEATGEATENIQALVGIDGPDETLVLHPVVARVHVEDVVAMFPAATPRANIESNLPVVLAALAEAGLDDRDLVLLALATIRAETEGFEPIDEQPSRYNTDPGAHPFNRYDDRLGNRGRPDGERYRGRGFVQLTGRDAYAEYGRRIGIGDALVEDPARANEPEIAAGILAAFLADRRRAAKYAILGRDLATARRLVNGGTHGLARFTDAFERGATRLA